MSSSHTLDLHPGPPSSPMQIRRFSLRVVEGPASGASCEASAETAGIGSHPLNQLVVDDPTVSRFHCELRVSEEGVRARDLGSRNGTFVDGLKVYDVLLRDGSLLRLGNTVIAFHLCDEPGRIELSEAREFGKLVGSSVAMRSVFALLERAAEADVTVLLEGETGTGKSQAAEAVHERSRRKDGPFVVVDCASIPSSLIESELFGHERGAFTGAESRRVGAFEEAAGGTVLLDEIGELPLGAQPKLLRVIETRQVRRVGSNYFQPVDVRIIAATHRDLRSEVNAGRFRSDLYFRLAVVKIEMPPLRRRPEDVPETVVRLLAAMRTDADRARALITPELLGRLARAAWPGNVRELRNFLERLSVFEQTQPGLPAAADPAPMAVDATLPFADARGRVLAAFERAYLTALLRQHGGDVAVAAERCGVDRGYLYKLLRRHGLKPGR